MVMRKNESQEEFKQRMQKVNKEYAEKHRNGYRGTYKGKNFRYKVKLPKGAVRHHVVYRDEDPNYGIVFTTREYHRDIHANEKTGRVEKYE